MLFALSYASFMYCLVGVMWAQCNDLRIASWKGEEELIFGNILLQIRLRISGELGKRKGQSVTSVASSDCIMLINM